MRSAIGGPPPARWAAFRALEFVLGPAALASLDEYAASGDAHVRRAAVEVIGRHPEGRTLVSTICGALTDSDPFVVRTACIAAGRLNAVAARDRICSLLVDQSADTRSAAIRALGDVWEPSDQERVLKLFVSDPSEEVRKEAAWILRSRVDDALWIKLFDLWREAKLPRYRAWACELVERFASTAQREDLERMSEDDNGHVRKAAGKALVRINGAG